MFKPNQHLITPRMEYVLALILETSALLVVTRHLTYMECLGHGLHGHTSPHVASSSPRNSSGALSAGVTPCIDLGATANNTIY